MKNQEYLIQLQLMEQEANQLGEQIKLINQQVSEMQVLKKNIKEISAFGEEEIFSEIGKGVFLKSKIIKSDFLIEVGSKIIVPKTTEEITLIVDEQVKKLESAKDEISKKIQEINDELNKLISQAHIKEKKKTK